jgi:hypothetical protein
MKGTDHMSAQAAVTVPAVTSASLTSIGPDRSPNVQAGYGRGQSAGACRNQEKLFPYMTASARPRSLSAMGWTSPGPSIRGSTARS